MKPSLSSFPEFFSKNKTKSLIIEDSMAALNVSKPNILRELISLRDSVDRGLDIFNSTSDRFHVCSLKIFHLFFSTKLEHESLHMVDSIF